MFNTQHYGSKICARFLERPLTITVTGQSVFIRGNGDRKVATAQTARVYSKRERKARNSAKRGMEVSESISSTSSSGTSYGPGLMVPVPRVKTHILKKNLHAIPRVGTEPQRASDRRQGRISEFQRNVEAPYTKATFPQRVKYPVQGFVSGPGIVDPIRADGYAGPISARLNPRRHYYCHKLRGFPF